MSILTNIIIFTLIGSVASLIGGIILLSNEKFSIKISHYLSSFAAGTLLGTAFFDLLPEASEEAGDHNIFFWTLIGILTFFILERSIHWLHHHRREHLDIKTKPTASLIIIGDSIHNFIDGVVITATFLVNVPLGIITALSVAAHEIPQEIGDFGVLLHLGFSRKRVLIVNIISAITALAGALLMFYLSDYIKGVLPIFISVTAGFFIYIAASDLIPEIHQHNNNKIGLAFFESATLLAGVSVVWMFVSFFE